MSRRLLIRWNGLFALLAVIHCVGLTAQEVTPTGAAPTLEDLTRQSPWVFLGDSNTYAGGYVAILDAWLRNAGVSKVPKILNLGVSSETASGLSEVDHPFKRPCVHERLDKVLAMTKPKVVFVCYGMNDGIYEPPKPEILAAYKAGMMKLAAAVKNSGARLICCTPPIFESDVVRKRDKLGPTDQGRYAYFAAAENYDEVLEQQTEWLLTNEIGADAVIDLHQLLHSEKQERVIDEPAFCYSSDGVHFGAEAHALVAELIIKSLGAADSIFGTYPSNEQISVADKKMQLLRNAYLSATGKNRPGLKAGYPVWYAEQLASRLNKSL